MQILDWILPRKCFVCGTKIKGTKHTYRDAYGTIYPDKWACQSCEDTLEEERNRRQEDLRRKREAEARQQEEQRRRREEEIRKQEDEQKRKREHELQIAREVGERRANFKMLRSAAETGNTQDVVTLLAKGIAINAVNEEEQAHETVLHNAACTEHVDICRLLLDGGAQVDALDYHQQTPLHWLGGRDFSKGSLPIAELLLERGAAIDARDLNALTPLHMPAFTGRQALAEMLLSKGADPHARSKRGRTPFYYAVEAGHDNVANVFSERTRETMDAILGIAFSNDDVLKAIKSNKPIIRIMSKEVADQYLNSSEFRMVYMLGGYRVQSKTDGLAVLFRIK